MKTATTTTETFIVGSGEKLCFGDTSKIENLGNWNANIQMMIIYLCSNISNSVHGSEFQVCYDVNIKDNIDLKSKILGVDGNQFRGFLQDFTPTYTNNFTVLRKEEMQVPASIPTAQGIRYPCSYASWGTISAENKVYLDAHSEMFWDPAPIVANVTTFTDVWKRMNLNCCVDTLFGGTTMNCGNNLSFIKSSDPGYKFGWTAAANTAHTYQIQKSIVTSYQDKINWFLDDNISTTHLYSDLSTDLSNWVYYNVHNPWVDKYTKIDDFDSKVVIFGVGKNNPGTPDMNCWFNGVVGKCWYDKDYGGGTQPGGYYSLPRPKEISKKPSEIINSNFNFSNLTDFVSEGFHGYLTEGMPLYYCKTSEGIDIEFGLDTTTLTNSVYFAISGRPFESDKKIATKHDMTNLILKVDGTQIDDGYILLDNTKIHNVKISVNKVGSVFYKLGFDPATSTIKTYGTISIPAQMTLTRHS